MNKKKSVVLTVILTLAIGVIAYFSILIIECREQPLGQSERVEAQSDSLDSIVNENVNIEDLDLNEKREITEEMNLRLQNNNIIDLSGNINGNLLNALINNL